MPGWMLKLERIGIPHSVESAHDYAESHIKVIADQYIIFRM